MSLSRNFFREMRPLFRMLEEPFALHPGFQSNATMRSLLNDGVFERARMPVDVSEQGDTYVIEAELPGVKKEDVDVRIGDSGRSVTIEGKVAQRSAFAPAQPATPAETTDSAAVAAPSEGAVDQTQTQSQVALASSPSNQLSAERVFSSNTQFSRNIVLPRPVDAARVSAKLVDGVLTLHIPKAEEPGAVKINIE